jgi:hypothetical protein
VLQVERLGEGVWRWSCVAGRWSHLLELPDALLLIDPEVPADAEDAERFWRHLDEDVARHGRPVAVVITSHAREEHARAVLERYPGSRRVPAY